MKQVLTAIAVAGALFAAQAYAQRGGHGGHDSTEHAHTAAMLASSMPADGAVLAQSPRTLTLVFAHPVMLQTVALNDEAGAAVQGATFRRAATASTTYSVALPTMESGAYQVRWTATGSGHDMQGQLGFTVE